MERSKLREQAETETTRPFPVGEGLLTEAGLLEAARGGDEHAWKVLVERHRPELVAQAGRHECARWQEPEDRAQDALMQAWQKRRLLDSARGSFGAWVAELTRNLGKKAAGKRQRRKRLVGEVVEEGEPHADAHGTPSPEWSPEAALEATRARETCDRALESLTTLEYAVVANWAEGGRSRDFEHPSGADYKSAAYRATLKRARDKLAVWGRRAEAARRLERGRARAPSRRKPAYRGNVTLFRLAA